MYIFHFSILKNNGIVLFCKLFYGMTLVLFSSHIRRIFVPSF